MVISIDNFVQFNYNFFILPIVRLSVLISFVQFNYNFFIFTYSLWLSTFPDWFLCDQVYDSRMEHQVQLYTLCS